jgi:hypothetical protein
MSPKTGVRQGGGGTIAGFLFQNLCSSKIPSGLARKVQPQWLVVASGCRTWLPKEQFGVIFHTTKEQFHTLSSNTTQTSVVCVDLNKNYSLLLESIMKTWSFLRAPNYLIAPVTSVPEPCTYKVTERTQVPAWGRGWCHLCLSTEALEHWSGTSPRMFLAWNLLPSIFIMISQKCGA